jgi:hypothetical protein
MSSSNIFFLYRHFAGCVYLSKAQNRIPPLFYTVYTCIQYNYLVKEGRERKRVDQRKRERGNIGVLKITI